MGLAWLLNAISRRAATLAVDPVHEAGAFDDLTSIAWYFSSL